MRCSKVHTLKERGQQKVKLTSDDQKRIAATAKAAVEDIHHASELARWCLILDIMDPNAEGFTFGQSIHKSLSTEDPLTGNSATTPIGKLKALIGKYFSDNDIKFNGEPDDFSGVVDRDDGELLRLLKEKMIYPAVTYTKEGWKLCHEDKIVEGDDAIAIKVSGGMQTFEVIVNEDEEADEIVVSSEKRMSLQLQVSHNLLTSHRVHQLTFYSLFLQLRRRLPPNPS